MDNYVSKSMVFFETIMTCISNLNLSAKLKVKYYEGILCYGLYGIKPDFDEPILKALFIALQPNIDANNARRDKYLRDVENGKKGGRPRKTVSDEKSALCEVKTTQTKTPSKTIDVDVDVDVDVDADVDADVDVEKETKDISFISSSSSSKEKEKEKSEKSFSLHPVDGTEPTSDADILHTPKAEPTTPKAKPTPANGSSQCHIASHTRPSDRSQLSQSLFTADRYPSASDVNNCSIGRYRSTSEAIQHTSAGIWREKNTYGRDQNPVRGPGA